MPATEPTALIVSDPAAPAALPTEAEVRAADLEDATATTASGAGDLREEMIRREAYAAYERRGCVPGHEDEDWLEAERKVDSANSIHESGE